MRYEPALPGARRRASQPVEEAIARHGETFEAARKALRALGPPAAVPERLSSGYYQTWEVSEEVARRFVTDLLAACSPDAYAEEPPE